MQREREWPYNVELVGTREYHVLALEEDAARTDRRALEVEYAERVRLRDALDRARVEAEEARALAQRTIDAGRAILSEIEVLRRENITLRAALEGAHAPHS